MICNETIIGGGYKWKSFIFIIQLSIAVINKLFFYITKFINKFN